MGTTRGFDVAADALIDNGVSPIFGLLGDANLAPIAKAVELGAEFFSCRNEMASVAMATGYALSTGQTAFATVTRGPGLVNALTGLVTAVRDRVPIVFLVGDTDADDRWSPQSIDHAEMVAPTGAEFLQCARSDQLAASVAQAKHTATELRKPVVLNIPSSLFDAPAVPQQFQPRHEAEGSAPVVPDPESVSMAARELRESERPLLIAGRGAIDAGPTLAKLARATGSLLATTLPVAGLFDGDQWCIGIAGGMGLGPMRRLMGESDVVLAVGTSLNSYITLGGRLLSEATIIQCDLDPKAIGRQHPVDLGIVGDAWRAADMLLDAALEEPRTGPGYRTPDVKRAIKESLDSPHWSDQSTSNTLDPRSFLRAFEESLPGKRRYFLDNGHFLSFPCQVLRPQFAGQLVPCLGFGAVGMALPTAIGAAIGRPAETAVAIVGDGGLLMSMTELETVGRLSPPVIIVVLNDSSYRAEVHHLHRHGLPGSLAEFPPTDFASIARSCGVPASTLTNTDELSNLEELLSAERRPLLLDVHVNPEIISEKFQAALARAHAARQT